MWVKGGVRIAPSDLTTLNRFGGELLRTLPRMRSSKPSVRLGGLVAAGGAAVPSREAQAGHAGPARKPHWNHLRALLFGMYAAIAALVIFYLMTIMVRQIRRLIQLKRPPSSSL